MESYEKNTPSVNVLQADKECLSIELGGHLNIHTASSIWKQCIKAQEIYQPRLLKIDAKKLDYCDGAGIALLSELKTRQLANNQLCEINNLHEKPRRMLEMILNKEPAISDSLPQEKLSDRIRHNFGFFAVGVVGQIEENIRFVGKLTVEIWKAALKPRSIRWKDMWKAAQQVGPNGLPIIAGLGFLIGLISAFQAAITLEQFGAQVYVGSLVGITLVRELGPLMTAVLLAGRTASSFSAEIGTMKINQEIDALSTMGLDSVKFLVIPRIIATTLMAPFLNIFLIFFGLFACGIVIHLIGITHQLYFNQLIRFIKTKDVIESLIKVTTFGFLIAAAGCLHGLKTKIGASAVGVSTTKAVVAAIVIVAIADGAFAAIFYALGI